jgi:hypothetical protein
MKSFAMNIAAYVLIAVGFVVSTQHAYVFGLAKCKLESSAGPDTLRLHSIQNVSVTGFAGGIIILIIGQVLLYRSLRQVPPDPGRDPKSLNR